MCHRNYAVIEFFDGLQLIPRNWISIDKSLAYFPDMTTINSKQFDKLVLNTVQPHSSWEAFEIKKIWASSGNKFYLKIFKPFTLKEY